MHVARVVLSSISSVARLSDCITGGQKEDHCFMVDQDEAIGLFAVLSGE